MSLVEPMGVAEVVLFAWAGMAVAMGLLWAAQLRTGDASIVDVGWAFGTGAVAIALVILASDGDAARRGLAAAMAAVWSVRLGVHLWRRIRAGAGEEGRYRYLREHLGRRAGPGLFAFFQIQAIWAVMFAMPVWAASEATRALDWLDAVGMLVWVAGVLGESVADRQLARFRADPRRAGQTCDTGLWGWSRHPNYFFEWLQWWGFVALGAGAAHWWVTLAGVAVMYLFITRLTGIPYTEKQALRSRGASYRRYRREVPAFFPRPPDRRATRQVR